MIRQAFRIRSMGKHDDKEWLSDKYLIDKLNAREIAEIAGVSDATIRNRLRKFGIKTRNVSECASLAMNKPESKDKISALAKSRWENSEYRHRGLKHIEKIRQIPRDTSYHQTDEYKSKLRESSKKLWADDKFRNRMLSIFSSEEYRKNYRAVMESDRYRNLMSSLSKKGWSNNEYRTKTLGAITKKNAELWNDAAFRDKMAHLPKVLYIQDILYSVLDDLGVSYHREYNGSHDDDQCVIGPYSFDCVIPRVGAPNLLIECQGDYWHNLSHIIKRDVSKFNYISNNFQDRYEIRYLWEHEFKCLDKIAQTIRYWLGIDKLDIIDSELDDLIISEVSNADCRLLLSKYHYLSNPGRGGITYGAYRGDKLIAVCVFSPLIRQNITINGYEDNEVRELSRLCINPRYQMRNLASWFIAKCIKRLPCKYKCIISYADTTFNHIGTVYKASNFVLDSKVRPDYRYIDNNGWVMHKKTLYGHARKMKMTEREFAEEHGYSKIYGREKLRYIYYR